MKDIRQTKEYANYLKHIGWSFEKIDKNFVFIKKLPIIGSVAKIQRPTNFYLTNLSKISKKHRLFQMVLEPYTTEDYSQKDLNRAGFRISKSPYLPTKTLELDLTKSKTLLYKNIKKDARYSLRKNQNAKIRFLTDENEIEKFHKGWRKNVNLKRYVTPLPHLIALKRSFGQACAFITNYNYSSGAIFVIAGKKAYYWQAFTGESARKSLIQYKIVWEGILWCKRKGAKVFDFEGIYDERFPQEAWHGFTHFKKSFGGVEKYYPGTFVKNLPPIKINQKLIPSFISKRLPLFFILLAIFVLVFSLNNTQTVIDFSKNHPLVAPFIIILWRILGVLIPPIPGGILALAMIPVFGWLAAYIYGAVGLLIGCSLAFLLARHFGPPLVSQFIPLDKLEKWEGKLGEETQFVAFLAIRFTTGAVLDFVSYIAGLTKISFMKFFVATAISILPDSLYYYFGESLYKRNAPALVSAILLLIGFFVILKKAFSTTKNITKNDTIE